MVFLFRGRSSVSCLLLIQGLRGRGGEGPASSQTNLKTIITTNLQADLMKPAFTASSGEPGIGTVHGRIQRSGSRPSDPGTILTFMRPFKPFIYNASIITFNYMTVWRITPLPVTHKALRVSFLGGCRCFNLALFSNVAAATPARSHVLLRLWLNERKENCDVIVPHSYSPSSLIGYN